MIARKIGEILKVKSIAEIDGPSIFSKWVGEAEKNIRNLFAAAEKGTFLVIALVIEFSHV